MPEEKFQKITKGENWPVDDWAFGPWDEQTYTRNTAGDITHRNFFRKDAYIGSIRIVRDSSNTITGQRKVWVSELETAANG